MTLLGDMLKVPSSTRYGIWKSHRGHHHSSREQIHASEVRARLTHEVRGFANQSEPRIWVPRKIQGTGDGGRRPEEVDDICGGSAAFGS